MATISVTLDLHDAVRIASALEEKQIRYAMIKQEIAQKYFDLKMIFTNAVADRLTKKIIYKPKKRFKKPKKSYGKRKTKKR